MQRSVYAADIKELLNQFPIVALVGPRQCGKTTLALEINSTGAVQPEENRFDLESPASRARLENAEQVLGRLHGLVVIDEIQLRPELFPLLRVPTGREYQPAF